MISNEIREYIKNNLPICNNKLELAYAIYILLGQVLYYSPEYANTKDVNVVSKPEEVTLKNPYIICYTWSPIYNALLKEYGINSYIDNRNKEHSLVIIEDNDIKITADVTKASNCSVYDVSNDLASIKFGLDINFFYLTPNQKNFQEKKELLNEAKRNINERLNIDTETEKEIQLYINMLDESEIDLEGRTILLLNLLNNLYKKTYGEVERRQLFDRYYKQIFKDENFVNKQISIVYNGYTMAKKLVIVESDFTMFYLEDEEGFRISSKEEIDDLLKRKIIRFKYPQDKTFYNLVNEKLTQVKIML